MYKRQVLTNKAIELSNCQKEKMIEAYEKIISNIQEDDLAVTPVSYTHLDVYKRQLHALSERKSCRGIYEIDTGGFEE